MAQEPGDSRMEGVAGLAPRLRPPVQLGDPPTGIQARHPFPSFDLSILADADTNQPGGATNPEALTLPITLHHRRERCQGRHAPKPRTVQGRLWP